LSFKISENKKYHKNIKEATAADETVTRVTCVLKTNTGTQEVPKCLNTVSN